MTILYDPWFSNEQYGGYPGDRWVLTNGLEERKWYAPGTVRQCDDCGRVWIAGGIPDGHTVNIWRRERAKERRRRVRRAKRRAKQGAV